LHPKSQAPLIGVNVPRPGCPPDGTDANKQALLTQWPHPSPRPPLPCLRSPWALVVGRPSSVVGQHGRRTTGGCRPGTRSQGSLVTGSLATRTPWSRVVRIARCRWTKGPMPRGSWVPWCRWTSVPRDVHRSGNWVPGHPALLTPSYLETKIPRCRGVSMPWDTGTLGAGSLTTSVTW
jgi:hypothetical protein